MYKGTVEYGRKRMVERQEEELKNRRAIERNTDGWWKWMRVKALRLLRDCHSLLKK